LDISAGVPEFLVVSLLMGLACVLSQCRFEEPVRLWDKPVECRTIRVLC